MFDTEIEKHHVLLVLSKLKYNRITDRFVTSQFANQVIQDLKLRKIQLKNHLGASAIQNHFTEFSKGNYDAILNSKIKDTLSVYCEYLSYSDFTNKLTIYSDRVEVCGGYQGEGEVVTLNKKECIGILRSLGNYREAKKVYQGILADNYLVPEICLDFELETEDISVSVITANLEWAHYHKERIIKAITQKNAKFRYLLTGNANTYLHVMQNLARLHKCQEKLKILSLLKETNNTQGVYEGLLFREFAGVVFPLPNDIVIYVGIPNKQKESYSDYIFQTVEPKSAIAVIGTKPIRRGAAEGGMYYYDIAIERNVAIGINEWFELVWQSLIKE